MVLVTVLVMAVLLAVVAVYMASVSLYMYVCGMRVYVLEILVLQLCSLTGFTGNALPRSVVAVVVDSRLLLLSAVSADIPATGTVHIATAVEAADYLDVVCKVGVDGEVRHDGLLVCVVTVGFLLSVMYLGAALLTRKPCRILLNLKH